MNYEEWVVSVPEEISGDPVWKIKVYRLALFVMEIGWQDVTKLARDNRTISTSDQLYRALGSMCSNLVEGYSRSSGKDRARFYEYALGSARESRGWYYQSRHVLGETVVSHRLSMLTQIIRLLLTMVPQQRARFLSEGHEIYQVIHDEDQLPVDESQLNHLLGSVPLP